MVNETVDEATEASIGSILNQGVAIDKNSGQPLDEGGPGGPIAAAMGGSEHPSAIDVVQALQQGQSPIVQPTTEVPLKLEGLVAAWVTGEVAKALSDLAVVADPEQVAEIENVVATSMMSGKLGDGQPSDITAKAISELVTQLAKYAPSAMIEPPLPVDLAIEPVDVDLAPDVGDEVPFDVSDEEPISDEPTVLTMFDLGFEGDEEDDEQDDEEDDKQDDEEEFALKADKNKKTEVVHGHASVAEPPVDVDDDDSQHSEALHAWRIWNTKPKEAKRLRLISKDEAKRILRKLGYSELDLSQAASVSGERESGKPKRRRQPVREADEEPKAVSQPKKLPDEGPSEDPQPEIEELVYEIKPEDLDSHHLQALHQLAMAAGGDSWQASLKNAWETGMYPPGLDDNSVCALEQIKTLMGGETKGLKADKDKATANPIDFGPQTEPEGETRADGTDGAGEPKPSYTYYPIPMPLSDAQEASILGVELAEMGQTQRVRGRATTVTDRDGVKTVIYHNTDVVIWDQNTGEVTLNSGGWMTNTTKTRMNQAANEYGLGFGVYQQKFDWYVDLPDGTTVDFKDGMTFKTSGTSRRTGEEEPESPYNRESKGFMKFTDEGETYEGSVQYKHDGFLDVLDTKGFLHVISESAIVADGAPALDDGEKDYVDIAMSDGLDAALVAMSDKED